MNTTGNIATTTTTTASSTITMANRLHQQHQPQKHEQQLQTQDHYDEHYLNKNQEQYSGASHGQHLAVDIISLPPSVINRSFDNVSPRPYISIEGMFQIHVIESN